MKQWPGWWEEDKRVEWSQFVGMSIRFGHTSTRLKLAGSSAPHVAQQFTNIYRFILVIVCCSVFISSYTRFFVVVISSYSCLISCLLYWYDRFLSYSNYHIHRLIPIIICCGRFFYRLRPDLFDWVFFPPFYCRVRLLVIIKSVAQTSFPRNKINSIHSLIGTNSTRDNFECNILWKGHLKLGNKI